MIMIDDYNVPMYSDDYKYYPHDVLILEHFPYEDIAALQHEEQYDAAYTRALGLESIGSPPLGFPWPLPPTRPADQLGRNIKSWKAETQRVIKTRIAAYTPEPAIQHTYTYETPKTVSDRSATSVQRALWIPEIA
jgi:hypothetical protein